MASTAVDGATASVPEQRRWALTALAAAAAVAAVIALGSLLSDASTLIGWLQPDATVSTTFDAAVVLPPAGTRDVYAGGPYVADGDSVTATSLTTTVSGLDLGVRVELGLAPVVRDGTAIAVAMLLLGSVLDLRRGAPFSPRLARPLERGAVVLAVGSTAAQLLAMTARLGFGRVMWEGRGIDGLGGGQRADFSFTPLVVSAALVAVAVVLRRAARLEHDSRI